ncbi:hypothetical protein QQP08_015186 [Theobroma cacao]|uniref:Transmembrane protein n=1 Tax=Theobroma cacao TaxID=3641 RepID=A0A061F0W9_THECC|nr:Uncharacterized protein TCM_026263 [Theobroma cacao]WRX22699.1 hypothetical protein QQP08_015186 [Theobroma cacao]
MASCRKVVKFTVTFIAAVVLLFGFDQHVLATRPLDEVPFEEGLIVQSLQRGPVPPSGGNPCTNIPGRSRGRCTLSEMNVAGGGGGMVAHPPPAFS